MWHGLLARVRVARAISPCCGGWDGRYVVDAARPVADGNSLGADACLRCGRRRVRVQHAADTLLDVRGLLLLGLPQQRLCVDGVAPNGLVSRKRPIRGRARLVRGGVGVGVRLGPAAVGARAVAYAILARIRATLVGPFRRAGAAMPSPLVSRSPTDPQHTHALAGVADTATTTARDPHDDCVVLRHSRRRSAGARLGLPHALRLLRSAPIWGIHARLRWSVVDAPAAAFVHASMGVALGQAVRRRAEPASGPAPGAVLPRMWLQLDWQCHRPLPRVRDGFELVVALARPRRRYDLRRWAHANA